MHFLIDTNIFVYFLDDPDTEDKFAILQELIERKSITLLVTETLFEEWTRQKMQSLYLIEKKLREANRHRPVGDDDINILMSYKVEKAKKIDVWLAAGIQIPLSNEVSRIAVDRSNAGFKPFSSPRSIKGLQDCLIFYGATEYAKYKGISRMAFVTNNKTDFGDKALFDTLKQSEVEIDYFNTLDECFHSLNDALEIESIRSKGAAQSEAISYVLEVDSPSDDMLDYLHRVIEKMREQIEFVPTEILRRVSPFRIRQEKNKVTLYYNFKLTTNNRQLYRFFQQIDYSGKGTFKDDSGYENTGEILEKLSDVLIFLRNNLVFFIAHHEEGEILDIRTQTAKPCPCAHCKYLMGDIAGAVNHVTNVNGKKITGKDALTASELGLYGQSLGLYMALFEKAGQQGRKVRQYMLLLHSIWEALLIGYSDDDEIQKLIEKTRKYKLDNLLFKFHNSPDFEKELILYLNRGDMMRRYCLTLRETAEKIKKHYYSQLKGNTSENSYALELLCQFMEIQHFIILNSVPYTAFSDFEKIAELYIECTFMLLGMNEYQTTRLQKLDDLRVGQLLFYGKSDTLINYYYTYVKTPIKYELDQASGTSVSEILTILNNSTVAAALGSKEETTPTFQLKSRKLASNAFALVSIIDFPKSTILEAGEILLRNIASFNGNRFADEDAIQEFINAKNGVLGADWVKLYMSTCINNDLFHDHEEFLAVLSAIKPEIRTAIVLDTEVFDYLLLRIFKECATCHRKHLSWISHIYPILQEDQKTIMRNKLNDEFDQRFNGSEYYDAVMDGYIEPERHYKQYLEYVKQPSGQRPLWMAGELIAPSLSSALNLSFFTGLPLPEQWKKDFSGISDYYDWMLNLESFDYSKFKPIWVAAYKTAPVLTRVFAVPEAKRRLKEYALKNPGSAVASIYVEFADKS